MIYGLLNREVSDFFAQMLARRCRHLVEDFLAVCHLSSDQTGIIKELPPLAKIFQGVDHFTGDYSDGTEGGGEFVSCASCKGGQGGQPLVSFTVPDSERAGEKWS